MFLPEVHDDAAGVDVPKNALNMSSASNMSSTDPLNEEDENLPVVSYLRRLRGSLRTSYAAATCLI